MLRAVVAMGWWEEGWAGGGMAEGGTEMGEQWVAVCREEELDLAMVEVKATEAAVVEAQTAVVATVVAKEVVGMAVGMAEGAKVEAVLEVGRLAAVGMAAGWERVAALAAVVASVGHQLVH